MTEPLVQFTNYSSLIYNNDTSTLKACLLIFMYSKNKFNKTQKSGILHMNTKMLISVFWHILNYFYL